MIRKIISGGQTGADRAGLDVAIDLGISHGGWIPKGRKTEDGTLPDKYQLQEMPTASYPKRTEQNVIDSDGTLILSHGKLTGGSALTMKLAKKHERPWLHINFLKANGFRAAEDINKWIMRNGIKVLNVAGSRASKDPLIYDATYKALKAAFHLAIVDTGMNQRVRSGNKPKTVDQAVDRLVSELNLKDKAKIAKMDERDLSVLYLSIGEYIRENFGLGRGNEELMQSCLLTSGGDHLHEESASMVIIEALWRKLRETHTLRAV